MAVFGLSHVDVAVTHLERTEQLFTQLLAFSVLQRGDGYIDIDTGTCTLRLIKTSQVEHPVSLRIQVSDVEGTAQQLVAGGLKLRYEPMRNDSQQLLAQLADGDGHTFIIWRDLTEDEYLVVPELPKEMTWRPEAEELLKSLLKSVPALFRALVRRRVAHNAEHLADTTHVVTREQVIRSFILSSAKVTRFRVRQPLIDHGIDLEKYAADFAA